MHGAGAPQVRASAQRRLEALVDPAIVALGYLIDNGEPDIVRLGASRDVLDRAGLKAPVQVDTGLGAVLRAALERLGDRRDDDVQHDHHGERNGHDQAVQQQAGHADQHDQDDQDDDVDDGVHGIGDGERFVDL
jgi:hypothetical protein